jgi:hypothetical protein
LARLRQVVAAPQLNRRAAYQEVVEMIEALDPSGHLSSVERQALLRPLRAGRRDFQVARQEFIRVARAMEATPASAAAGDLVSPRLLDGRACVEPALSNESSADAARIDTLSQLVELKRQLQGLKPPAAAGPGARTGSPAPSVYDPTLGPSPRAQLLRFIVARFASGEDFRLFVNAYFEEAAVTIPWNRGLDVQVDHLIDFVVGRGGQAQMWRGLEAERPAFTTEVAGIRSAWERSLNASDNLRRRR